MATLSEGAYLIISVGSSKAIDVKGDSDKDKANVMQYTPNNTAGQIWTLSKTTKGWQILCSLSGKSLDIQVGNDNVVSNGDNVVQYSDKDKTTQRWGIAEASGTKAYGGKNYQKYYIRSKSKSLALGVKSNSNSNNANIQMQTYNASSNYQQWIFVPVQVLKKEDTYRIITASNPKMCLGIAGKSTADNANVSFKMIDENDESQIWRVDIDDDTSTVRFYNAHSGKCLDVRMGSDKAVTKGDLLVQYKKRGASSQNWLPQQLGTMKDANKKTIPSYELRCQAGANLYATGSWMAGSITGVFLENRNKKVNQRFGFVKAEILGKKLGAPGGVTPTKFTASPKKAIQVKGLQFDSKNTRFQARYMIKRYTKLDLSKYVKTDWHNVHDNSTTRDGWGIAQSSTIYNKNAAVSGIVPFNIREQVTTTNPKGKKVKRWRNRVFKLGKVSSKAGGKKVEAVDIIVEVRTLSLNYNGGWAAHSSPKRTTIKLRQIPTPKLNELKLAVGNNSVGVKADITSDLNVPVIWCRARLLGSDKLPISSWLSASKTSSLYFYLGDKLYRFPTDNETVYVECQILYRDDILITQTFHKNFNRSGGSSVSLSTSISADGSGIVTITKPSYHKSDCCIMKVADIDGNRYIKCKMTQHKSGQAVTWVADPPLNTDVTIQTFSRNPGASSYVHGSTTVNVPSHASVWTWTEHTALDSFATLLTNTDAPPKQNRKFTANVTMHSPAGRRWPVGFAPLAISGDMSVDGTIVDEHASYQAAGPVPETSVGTLGIAAISKLVRLAGKGIHPIYRTPYGDRYQVIVSGVDVTKSDLNYTDVSVTQSIVED